MPMHTATCGQDFFCRFTCLQDEGEEEAAEEEGEVEEEEAT